MFEECIISHLELPGDPGAGLNACLLPIDWHTTSDLHMGT